MIRPLRQRHRVVVCTLGVLLPVLSGDASKSSRELVVRDPDGHALQLIEVAKAFAERLAVLPDSQVVI